MLRELDILNDIKIFETHLISVKNRNFYQSRKIFYYKFNHLTVYKHHDFFM